MTVSDIGMWWREHTNKPYTTLHALRCAICKCRYGDHTMGDQGKCLNCECGRFVGGPWQPPPKPQIDGRWDDD